MLRAALLTSLCWWSFTSAEAVESTSWQAVSSEEGPARVRKAAQSIVPTTDKVMPHTYHLMYGALLLPLAAMHGDKFKMLEIGLGCTMEYGPGASARLWRSLLPTAEIWFAESNGLCVNKARAEGKLDGLHTMIGSQSDPETLRRWVHQSGGGFHAIIDDGSHSNRDILLTLRILWPALRDGGLYFIEDLHVGRSQNGPVVSDVLQGWAERLMTNTRNESTHARAKPRNHTPLPPRLKFVLIQREAAVIAKCSAEDPADVCYDVGEQPEWWGALLADLRDGKDYPKLGIQRLQQKRKQATGAAFG